MYKREDGWQVRWKLPVEDVFVSTKKLFAAFKLLTELVKKKIFELIGEKESR